MARPETPIDPRTGPQAAFAVELRQLREFAGVTYRELAQRAHYSQGALCEAARGHRLPSWEATKAFVKGCGGDQQQWRARWEAAAAEIGGDSSTATAPGGAGDAVTAPSDPSDVREPLPNGGAPPLSSLTSPQEFHLALRAMRTRAGNPSLRDLSVSARKNGDVLPRSTLADALARTDRLPSLEIVEAFLGACDVQATEVDAVKSAWARVAYLQQRNSIPGSTRWEDSCPYRGLAAFTEDQAEVFYGRESMTSELLAKLAKRVRGGVGMLVVTGPSGAGKSSLLRAGLLPALANGKLGPGSQDWPRLVITPGSAPLDALAVHLAQLAGVNNAEVRESLAERPDKAHLSARQALLARAAQQTGSEPTVSPSRLLLIVDQFEELFTGVSDKAEREAFITSLCAMAGVGRRTTEVPPAIVVLGLRADFFSNCTAYAPLAETLGSGMFVVGPMTEVELRSAITGPAAAAGLSVEDGLADNVLAELRSTETAEGFDSGALPLLSQAMLLAWEQREGTTLTHHAYAAGGGIRSGIQTSAEAAYDNLTPAQQEAARRLFLRMVTFTDRGQPTRCPIQLNDVNVGSTTEDVNAALEEFATKRLITLDQDTAEIVHEVLVHTWKRLRSWIDQDREWLRLHRELESAASVWEENGRDPAFLYRESRLAAVQENLNETNSPVPPSVQLFLDSSRSHERRRTRKLRGLRSMAVGLLVVVALLAGSTAIVITDQNRRALKLVTAGKYAADSSRFLAADYPDFAMGLAVEASRLGNTPTTHDALLNAQSQYFVGQLAGHNDVINKVVFSPNGNSLAIASANSGAQLWNVASRQLIFAFPSPKNTVNDVEFSPDGRLLATAGGKGIAQLWDVASHRSIATLTDGSGGTLSAATFSPDGNLLATTSIGGAAWLWDVSSHQPIIKVGGFDQINKVVFSFRGNILATAGADGIVQLWNVTDPRHPVPLGPHLPLVNRVDYVNAMVFSPNGNILATARQTTDGTVQLWDVQNPLHPDMLATLPYHTKIVNAMAFSPNGNTLAIADSDGTTRLWDVSTHQQVGILKGRPNGSIRSVAFRPDGHIVATADNVAIAGNNDHIVRLWDTDGPILSSPAIGPVVVHMESSPDGHILATFSEDGTARLWNTVSRDTVPVPIDKTVAFSGDGRLLATADKNGNPGLWDIAGRHLIATLSDPTGSIDKIDQVAFGSKDHVLVTIGTEGIMRLWNVTDPFHPTPLGPLLASNIRNVVAFSGDGRLLATADKDGTTRLWDIAGRHLIATLPHPADPVKMVFSPDGDSLITATRDGTVRRWEAATGNLTSTIQLPGKNLYTMALSPDGSTLATTSSDDITTKLWDIGHGGELIATLAGHTGNLTTAAFGRDHSSLATASNDGTVRLWDLDPGRVIRHLCKIIGTVSKEQWDELMSGFSHQPVCP